MPPSAPARDITGQRVLVTGGAGFVGSRLAEALLPANTVWVLDDLSAGSREAVPDGAQLIVGDVRDRPLVAPLVAAADTVFHQAAVVSVERSVAAPSETHAVNATATLDLLEAARGADTRVVLASSAAVYGRPESVPQREDDRLAPESPYGVAKLAADRYARLYASLYGVPTVALRYFNVYGPPPPGHDTPPGVIGSFLRAARSGEPIEVHGDGSQTRDFVHVRDVVRANLRAATTDCVGRAFNVGTGESLSIAALAALVAEAAGGVEVVHTDAREGDVDHSRADTTAARDLLGFEAAVAPEEGVPALLE